MRLIFMGTPAFAVPSLASLVANGHEVAAVYTQPPRPAGRGHKLTPSPVHAFALEHGLEVRTPENFKASEDREAFAALGAEVAVVVAYGLILPRAILEAPELGCINVHASLLPRWRGAAPIQRAIMAGDRHTGVQVMQMEKGLDTGPILLSETVPIDPHMTADKLTDHLSHVGAELLPRALAALSRGGIVPHPQSEDGITYASKIDSAEAVVDWTRPAAEVDAHIRGLSPFPGAKTQLLREGNDPVRLKLVLSQGGDTPSSAAPGTIVSAGNEGIDVAAGDGQTVRLLTLQREGKAAQPASEFLRGMPIKPGDRLG
ncbi:methionyl-tRNA formyltransferase [Parvularcula sp. LCG005]|uniref:methionyl-tRNA formyltransferase n=1 Tax=Parvularcula sp. LCG005 TaxID=3078805 RepID=UPI0029421F89|nr:methionyl-tRNA formyltransferase [Parvularcula sp. LCG005]WOI53125.1 methionyl-tRNA formyltransferase [Parvularcula sp. LCG005]